MFVLLQQLLKEQGALLDLLDDIIADSRFSEEQKSLVEFLRNEVHKPTRKRRTVIGADTKEKDSDASDMSDVSDGSKKKRKEKELDKSFEVPVDELKKKKRHRIIDIKVEPSSNPKVEPSISERIQQSSGQHTELHEKLKQRLEKKKKDARAALAAAQGGFGHNSSHLTSQTSPSHRLHHDTHRSSSHSLGYSNLDLYSHSDYYSAAYDDRCESMLIMSKE
jgi:hypothetical protein